MTGAKRKRRARMPTLFDLCTAPPKARRILFVVPPLTGHINPTVALGAELTRRGHQVAWAGHPGSVAPLLEPGARLFAAEDPVLSARLEAAREGWLRLRGPAALEFLWEEFIIPLGHAMLPGVEAAVAQFRPDVVVADQQALAGAVAARRNGPPWVTSATTSAEFTRPLAGLPKVEAWVQQRMAGFQRAYGLPDHMDLRFSDHLVLVFSTPALIGSVADFPDHFAFVGPALGRPDGPEFPWAELDAGRPKVLVSLGTVNGPAGERFFQVAAEAVRDLRLQAIFVAPPGVLRAPPANVIVRSHVPQLALLPHMSAVVSHGGHNTVCEALAHGLPLVVAPIRDDQPIVARQVAAAGAGISVRFSRIQAGELRDALAAVLGDPVYRAAAGRVQSSFNAAGGAVEAADRLEKIT